MIRERRRTLAEGCGGAVNTAVTAVVVVVAVIDITLGALVLQRNSRSATNRLFAASASAAALWMIANYLCDNLPASDTLLLFLNRLTVALGSVMGIFMLAFALTFPSLRRRLSLKWLLALAPMAILAVLTIATPLGVTGITIESWGTNVVMGPLYPAVMIWAAVVLVAVGVSVFKRYRVARQRERLQFRYLYLGLFAFFVGSVVITGVVPYTTGSTEFTQLTPVTMLFFLIPTAYAMLRHRLLDIGVASLRGVTATLLLAAVAAFVVVIAGEWIDRSLVPLGMQTEAGLFLVGFVVLLGFGPLRTALERALDRVLRQRTYDPDVLLRQLGGIITTNLDPEAVASIVTDRLAEEMKLAFASVLFHAEGRPLMASSGPELPDQDLSELLGLPQNDDTLVADELEADDPRAAPLSDARTRVVIPLLHDGGRIGALILGQKLSGRLYSAKDLRFLEVLATETAAALRNASLFDELTQRVRELSALNQLASVLGADEAIQETLQLALQQAVEVTGAERGSVTLRRSDWTRRLPGHRTRPTARVLPRWPRRCASRCCWPMKGTAAGEKRSPVRA
jgi:GAF domain-containing protein